VTPPRPLPSIVPPGIDNEVQALAKARYQRSLTAAEDARLRALTFSPDADLERSRLFIARHPDLAGALLGETVRSLEGYETRRQAALDAGRALPDPSPADVAAVDRLADEHRATMVDPHEGLAERHREAFRAAILAGGLDLDAVRIWTTWQADHRAANEAAKRRAAAASGLGHATFADVRRPPALLEELEDCLGGTTVREDRPIIARG
jgi:hypothetical protein